MVPALTMLVFLSYLILCVESQLLWVHEGNSHAMDCRYCSAINVCSFWNLQVFHPLSHDDSWGLRPEAWGREACDLDAPFGVKHSIVSYFLYMEQLWITILITIYWEKKKLLSYGLIDALIYGTRTQELRREFITVSIQQSSRTRLSLRAYDLLSLRLLAPVTVGDMNSTLWSRLLIQSESVWLPSYVCSTIALVGLSF